MNSAKRRAQGAEHLHPGAKFQTLCAMRYALCMFLLLISISIPFPSLAQPSAAKTDFLIVENPRELLIYNKYEQRIDFREQRAIAPYQPMEILESSTLLNDNFTPCMRVRSGEGIYYLIKDEEENLVNVAQAGYHKIFRNCTALGDTAEVLADETIFITTTAPPAIIPESQKNFLQKGDKLLRVFRYQNSVYVQALTGKGDFGWSNLASAGQNRSWKIYRRSINYSEGIPKELQQSIAIKIDEVNFILERLFAHFNQKTGLQKASPRWDITLSSKRINISLNDPQYQDSFAESTKYLINSMENSLLGTPFGVFYDRGVIEVKSKK